MKESLEVRELQSICNEVRCRAFKTVLRAQSGHIGGSSSSVEIMVSLYFGGVLRFDPLNPQHPCRDRVLVRGHLGPLRYSIFSLLGWVEENELDTYRIFGSRLQGHEVMGLCPGVDITPSGSLGMLLSYGTGATVALKNQNLQSLVYVFLGDGEEQEGNVSEVARHAASLGLNNLVCIMDRNTKQLSRMTEEVDRLSDVRKIWEGYGWCIKEIKNGHAIDEILLTLREERESRRPTLIIAHTHKGYGLKGAGRHPSGYHTVRSCPREYVIEAIAELEERSSFFSEQLGSLHQVVGSRLNQLSSLPDTVNRTENPVHLNVCIPSFVGIDHFDEALVAYFRELVALFRNRTDMRLYVMTADWNNKTVVHECHFDQDWVNYIDVGIREQHLLAMAHGISVTDPASRIVTIDGDFLVYRANDQLQTIAQAGSKMVLIGTDSGLCESQNGSTHQSTGQPGMLVNMPNLVMLEPADTVDLHNCFNWALTEYSGPTYLRLHSTSVKQFSTSTRNICAYVAYEPVNPCQIVLVGAGLLLDSMVSLAERLDVVESLGIRVINIIDMEHLGHSFVELLEDGVPLLAVYNGNPFVLESAVSKAVLEQKKPRPSIIRGHGFTLGTSGKLNQLLEYFHLDTDGIEEVIRQML